MTIRTFLLTALTFFTWNAFASGPIQLHPSDRLDRVVKIGPQERACLSTAAQLLERSHQIYHEALSEFLSEKITFRQLQKRFPRNDAFFDGYQTGWQFPSHVLTDFEGGWHEATGGPKARHIWLNSKWNKQYILKGDGSVAVNYIDQKGTICSVVREGQNIKEFLGAYFPGTKKSKPYLKWTSSKVNFFTIRVKNFVCHVVHRSPLRYDWKNKREFISWNR